MRSEAASPEAAARAEVFSRPVVLMLVLLVCSLVPVTTAAVRVLQIPLGGLPEDSLRLAVVPGAYFLHALSGLLFGLLGPLQWVRALRLRYGALHRLAGRVFVMAGAGLAVSGLQLLFHVQSIATGLLDGARGVFGLALIVALVQGLAAARAQNLPRHRAWMIRAYAIGMGTGPVALVLFPIYLITGQPPTGLACDLVVVGTWLLSIGVGEGGVRRIRQGGQGPRRSGSVAAQAPARTGRSTRT